MQNKVAISLCDKTGLMMKPWAENGYTCYAVDIQHKQRSDREQLFEGGGKIIFTWGDVRSWVPPDNCEIVFVAAFPVCTNLSGSGARDFTKKGIPMLMDGLILFNACYQVAKWSGAPFCVENPSGVIPTHFRKADYTFHPWYYGDLLSEADMPVDGKRIYDAGEGIHQQTRSSHAKNMVDIARGRAPG